MSLAGLFGGVLVGCDIQRCRDASGRPYDWVAAPDALFGEYDLPQLVLPRPETAGTGKQVVGPHAVKTFIVPGFDFIPIVGEIAIPGHQGLIIVGPEAVPVLKHQHPFTGRDDLTGRRQHGIGKDIFVQPWVRAVHRCVSRDGLQQKQAVRFQAAMHDLHEGPVVA